MKTTLDTIKGIRLYQGKDGYRFSVDALLLDAFVNLKRAAMIADLGAGSGIVGILLAKRYPRARVTLIELQKSLHELAERNIELNGLGDRVSAVKMDIRKIDGEGLSGCDLVVSNPPFRRPLTGLLSRGEERSIARHEIAISMQGLLGAASSILRPRGRFFVVHLPERMAELFEGMRSVGLEPKRVRFVHGKKALEARMVLVEAVRGGRTGLKVEPPLFIYEDDGSYTAEMREIYGG